MNTTCETCGNTLHSGLSRTLGRCGACRLAEEGEPAFTPPPPDLGCRREGPIPEVAPGRRYRSTGQETTEA